MITRRLRLFAATLAACALAGTADVRAAGVLRAADIRIAITSPTACEVTLALTIDGGGDVDHRLESFEGSRIDGLAVQRAQRVQAPHAVGATQSLVLRPDAPRYELHYRAEQPESRRDRCPIWLPAVPADGQSRAVTITVQLPQSAVPASSMPSFRWNGSQGATTLGHIPAFVRIAYSAAGEPTPWDIVRTMDVIAMGVLVGASGLWIWRRR